MLFTVQMDSKIVRNICSNIRDPLDAKNRIHLTSRSIRLMCLLFEGKEYDVIDIHSTLLRIAYMKGSFNEKKHITLSDIITYTLSTGLIDEDHANDVSSMFSVEKDSIHGEVDAMKKILGSIRRT